MVTYNGRYENRFTYDANGNIETALAKNQSGQTIDDQIYHYQTVSGKKINNRMYALNDAATITSGNDLPSGQITFNNTAATINTVNNYSYDEIGEMKSDKQDEIAEIKWRVDGKIKEVIRPVGSTKKNLIFDYDAQGTRISKEVTDQQNNLVYKEFLVRDAQGNLMSTYRFTLDGTTGQASFKQTEKQIYGSALLGIDKTETELVGAPQVNTTTFVRSLGNKNYTGANHLGNDLVIFTDKKIPHDDDGNGFTDFYTADIVSSRDYGPFGEYLVNRNFSPNKYPNSFNGKRDDDELFGWQDYGSRNYIKGKRGPDSVDPLQGNLQGWSPYNFVRNNPILRIDPDGQWDIEVHVYKDRAKYGYGVAIVKDNAGNVIYRFQVRAEGSNHTLNNYNKRNRLATNADTPLGTYDIPDNNPWQSGGDRNAYGPNPRLRLVAQSGEALVSGREDLRIHGGRQETYNKVTGQWDPIDNAQLKCTYGCLRAFDANVKGLKDETDVLQAQDNTELPGTLTITNDLVKSGNEYLTPEDYNSSIYSKHTLDALKNASTGGNPIDVLKNTSKRANSVDKLGNKGSYSKTGTTQQQ